MVKHHPSINMLLEHSAGTLSWAVSLSISAHLQMCTQCRHQLYHFNHVGGALLESGPAEGLKPSSFHSLMRRIERADRLPAFAQQPKHRIKGLNQRDKGAEHADEGRPKSPREMPDSTASAFLEAPRVIRNLLSNDTTLDWVRVSPSLHKLTLSQGATADEVAVHRLTSGGKIAPHSHQALEISLVLSGHFSDNHGLYSPGDFLAKWPGEVHRPVATENEDCLYLSVVEAPAVNRRRPGWLSTTLYRFQDRLTRVLPAEFH